MDAGGDFVVALEGLAEKVGGGDGVGVGGWAEMDSDDGFGEGVEFAIAGVVVAVEDRAAVAPVPFNEGGGGAGPIVGAVGDVDLFGDDLEGGGVVLQGEFGGAGEAELAGFGDGGVAGVGDLEGVGADGNFGEADAVFERVIVAAGGEEGEDEGEEENTFEHGGLLDGISS